MKATVVCFSPTGNSRASAMAMANAIATEVELIDVTTAAAQHLLSGNHFAIFAAPVYGGRIPTLARQRFAGICGTETPCLVIASYGNRHYDDALLELADMAQAQGFCVKGAAAVVGRHTYGEIQVDRPNAGDLAQMADFARKVAAKPADSPQPVIPGNRPYRNGGAGGQFRPLTGDACVHCGLCVRTCPAQAIASDCATVSDACISCFRCIRSCPTHAKHMNVPAYNEFASQFSERLKQRRENEFFL